MSGEAYDDLLPIHDDRHLPLSSRKREHLFHLRWVFLDVHIDRPVAVDRPGLVCIWSGVCSVDNDLVHHRVHLGKFLPLSLVI